MQVVRLQLPFPGSDTGSDELAIVAYLDPGSGDTGLQIGAAVIFTVVLITALVLIGVVIGSEEKGLGTAPLVRSRRNARPVRHL